MSDNGNGTALAIHREEVKQLGRLSLSEAVQLGEILWRSGLYPDVKSAAACTVKVLAGGEMGFGPMASMAAVHVIEGKPAIGAHLMAAAIKRSPNYDFDIIEQSAAACELVFFERSLASGGEMRKGVAGWVRKKESIRYTMQEAVDTGTALAKDGKTIKANYRRSPDDMLFARCLSKGYRRYCPDLSGGVLAYDPDELDRAPLPPAIEERRTNGYITDADFSAPEQPTPVANLPEPTVQTPAPAPAAGKLTVQQMDRLDQLVTELGIQTETFNARVQQLYSTAPPWLTPAQADELTGKLEAALKARKEAEAAGPAASKS